MKKYFICIVSLCVFLFINGYNVYAGCAGVCLYKDSLGSYNLGKSDTIYLSSGTTRIYAIYNDACEMMSLTNLVWFKDGIAIDTTSLADTYFNGEYITPFDISLPGLYQVCFKSYTPTNPNNCCGSITVIANSVALTGINPIAKKAKEELHVFPNPSIDGYFVVNPISEGGQYAIQVYNTFGEVIIDKQGDSDSKLEFSLSNFPNGIYYVKLMDNSHRFSDAKIYLSQ